VLKWNITARRTLVMSGEIVTPARATARRFAD
jgi:hypothetical protein